MLGNVLEWCEDTWHETYEGAPADGSAWIGEVPGRLLRGGSFRRGKAFCRCATRFRGEPGTRRPDHGFRIVLEIGFR
jgi:formylglycine-generating enzyme required for sulfatase activity